MSKKITKEIEINVPDGYAFKKFGCAERGDYYIDIGNNIYNDGSVYLWDSFIDSHSGYLILTKLEEFKWPEILNYHYVAKDKDGRWFGFFRKPEICLNFNEWSTSCGTGYIIIHDGFNIKWPDVHWTDSLLKNPNK